MLAEIETGLAAVIKESPLGQRLRAVGVLPDLTDDSLIGRFSTDAPAIYVSLDAATVENGLLQVDCSVACLARNARGPTSARHGDLETIGLLPMLDAALTLLDGVKAGDARLYATGIDLPHDDTLYQRGVTVGLIRLQSTDIPITPALDESALADFKTFAADYDLEPFEDRAEHDQWLQEPPDHETSAPDLSDRLKLRE